MKIKKSHESIASNDMQWLDKLLRPDVIAPLIGLVFVIGFFGLRGFKAYLTHQERIEKIRQGLDPEDEP